MKDILVSIKNRIDKYGFHRYIVNQRTTPRYTYTIGLKDNIGFELILGGSMFFETNEELDIIFEFIIKSLTQDKDKRKFNILNLGNFELKKVDFSWSTLMMLGALDYYNVNKIRAFQIIPTDKEKYTIDTPNMSSPWSEKDIAWKYLSENVLWNHMIPENAVAITNLNALRGHRLTEYFRFENDEWEIFSGNGALEAKELIRIVPLSVLISADLSIEAFINDPVGKGKYRDSSDENNLTWYNWE